MENHAIYQTATPLVSIKELAFRISKKVMATDSQTRQKIHLAAVIASNFTNHMLTTGKEIASGAGIPFNLFEPLIKETISKALENGPEVSQTGPAV